MAVFPLVNALSATYKLGTGQPTFVHTKNSSSGGIAALLRGEVDIARSSRPLKAAEYNQAVEEGKPIRSFHIGYDAICLITNRHNPIPSLTIDQVQDLYFSNQPPSWLASKSIVGPLVPFGRSVAESGTAAIFHRVIAPSTSTPFAKRIQLSTEHVANAQAVQAQPNAIAFVPHALVPDDVNVLAIETDGGARLSCSSKHVRTAEYPLSRDLFLISHDPPTNDVARFLLYALSAEGQQVLKKRGFLPLRAANE